jgi:hypothetical protein
MGGWSGLRMLLGCCYANIKFIEKLEKATVELFILFLANFSFKN